MGGFGGIWRSSCLVTISFSQPPPPPPPPTLPLTPPQCPVFAEELGKAHSAGVDVLCAKVHWNTSGDCFYDGMIDVAVKK